MIAPVASFWNFALPDLILIAIILTVLAMFSITPDQAMQRTAARAAATLKEKL
jgi:hypothetical protein